MAYPTVTIHAEKSANAVFRHPWIFSGAIAEKEPGAVHGSLITLRDPKGRVLGTGTFSATSSIAVRLLDFGEATIDAAWLVSRFREADQRRRLMGYGPGTDTDTDGYRVVFGESDGMPGLVVDRYGDVLVVQIATAGMDALRDAIIVALQDVFAPRAIVERSDLSARKDEKLGDVVQLLAGNDPGLVPFHEHGLAFQADAVRGQKTGFFLDQKDLRQAVRTLAKDRRVLNLFSYSGASGIAAMQGGAVRVHNVDASEPALEGCLSQARLNGIAEDAFTTEQADVFQWLGSQEGSYGIVVADPPALIKSAKDAEEGKKAYHFLNRAAIRLVENGGILVTSSCSRFLPEEDFAFILRRASIQAGKRLSILKTIHQSSDHPLSIYFPEAEYLKSFVCEVRPL
ncbi:class I SAM-dependent rRNA methyltransferase [Candidatus Uhrbacteria bacterium]|nr:class I SAM-dependent rRNA methyltransferase [Candidatus Uhrbacteria bacterium]MBI4598931.1 class I SAM-dependent rRNA methyltransferase [Candidatus Uhrbacteria bacterium]